MASIPTYGSVVAKNLRRGFHGVDQHDYAALGDHLAPDVRHRFAGDHALGGERNDSRTVLAWFERVGRVLPDIRFEITDVAVAGWPANTTATARWIAHASLLDGGEPYANSGVHVVSMRWFKIVEIAVYLDTQRLQAALRRQANAGIAEAIDEPITRV